VSIEKHISFHLLYFYIINHNCHLTMPNKRSHKNGRRSKRGGGPIDFLNNLFSSKTSTDATAAATPVAADAPPEEDEGIFASIMKKIKSLRAPPIPPPQPKLGLGQPLPSTQQPPATNPMQQPSAANTMLPQPQDVGQGSNPFANPNPGGGSKRKPKTHKKHNHKTHKKHKTHNKRSRK
jgi:hypothetical protein